MINVLIMNEDQQIMQSMIVMGIDGKYSRELMITQHISPNDDLF